MKRQEYSIQIMRSGSGYSGRDREMKQGKIKIFPKSVPHIHKIFGAYGWFVTQLVPVRYEKTISLG